MSYNKLPQGPQGETGETGATGEPGDTGAVGAQGEAGADAKGKELCSRLDTKSSFVLIR